MKNLKPFAGKVTQSVQSYLNENLVIGSFLENGFEATLSSKTKVVSLWKGHFQFFANFWVMKLKLFSGKVMQSVQNDLNQNLVIRSSLEKDFGTTLRPKTRVVSVWKEHFSVFSKLFQLFANFSMKKLKQFLGEVRQSIQSYLNQNLVTTSVLENRFEATLSSKTSVVTV